jgi:hypothetical protein
MDHTNGAYWYSKEFVERMIPKLKTDRPFVTINVNKQCLDNAIVLIHSNDHPEVYTWLADYKNLILVCSKIATVKRMIEMYPKFHVVYLPMSVDKSYVEKFKVKRKTKDTAFVGRLVKCPEDLMKNENIVKIGNMDREKVLSECAKFKKVFAVGRCAIEASILGCKVYSDEDYPILDNLDAVPILQKFINEIDRKGK